LFFWFKKGGKLWAWGGSFFFFFEVGMVFRIVQIGALSREEQFVTEILNWYHQVLLTMRYK